jgi:hypothetical protein
VKNAGSMQIAANNVGILAVWRGGRPKRAEKKFYPVPGGTSRYEAVRLANLTARRSSHIKRGVQLASSVSECVHLIHIVVPTSCSNDRLPTDSSNGSTIQETVKSLAQTNCRITL